MTRAASWKDPEIVNYLCERKALAILLPPLPSALPNTYLLLNVVLLQCVTLAHTKWEKM